MAGSTPASATGDADARTAAVRPPQLDEGARGVVGLAVHRTAEMAGAPIGLVGRRSVSPWAEAWRRFKRHKLAVISLFVLAFMVLAVLLGPMIWKVAINEIDFSARLKPPSFAHPFGTDDLGQDILARMLYGGRISLAVGIMSRPALAVYDELRRMLLESLLWRQRLPIIGDASPLSAEELRLRYRELLNQLSDDLARTLQRQDFLDRLLEP